jgi:hypothetical protein
MNKELRERLYKFLDDNDWGWRREGVDEMIDMCQQDFLKRSSIAIGDLKIDKNYSGDWTNGFYMGNVQSLAAIKKEFEK